MIKSKNDSFQNLTDISATIIIKTKKLLILYFAAVKSMTAVTDILTPTVIKSKSE